MSVDRQKVIELLDFIDSMKPEFNNFINESITYEYSISGRHEIYTCLVFPSGQWDEDWDDFRDDNESFDTAFNRLKARLIEYKYPRNEDDFD